MSDIDPNLYVVSDYFATGEGRTVHILITRAHPRRDQDDYEVEPSFVDGKYDPGILKTTSEERAIREMKDFAGDWFGIGAELLPRDEFFKRFGNFLPKDLIDRFTSGEDQPFNFSFQQRIHFNFS